MNTGMSISVICFTQNGIKLAKKLAYVCKNVCIYAKHSGYLPEQEIDKKTIHTTNFINQGIVEWAGQQMREKNILLFIGACGIAVRAIAPHLTDKLHDSPVLVMDEKGEYVIPILSGHMGGANEIAMQIAELTGAVPVITTATYINHKFAVDLFAKKNNLYIVNREGIAKVSSKVLDGKDITISIEPGHICEYCLLPNGIHMESYPPEHFVDIVVTAENKKFDTSILLKPREYVIGMGCKRGKETEQLETFINRSIKEADISENQLFALASIEYKKDEKAFIEWSRKNQIPFVTYSTEQLMEVEGEFHTSDFVLEKVGVGNVCERAALRACGAKGTIIYEKHAEYGMTIAIAKRRWKIEW